MAISSNPTATTVAFTSPKQLSDQNSQGTELGTSSTDLIGFYGATPIVQPTAGFDTIFATAALDNGTLTKYQITNSTSAPAATTTLETTSTVTGILTGEVIAVNKPAAQAGLGIAGYRVSAANTIGINYTNISSGAITTTSETYDVISVSSNYVTTATLSPASVPATPAGSEQTFTVLGAASGNFPIVNKPTNQAGLGISNIRIVSNDVVAITFLNNSSGAITPTASESYSFAFLPTLVPDGRTLNYKVAMATSAIAATTTTDVSTTITGLSADDVITGVSKPSYQASIGVVGYRVGAANQINVTYVSQSSGAITTTAEAYGVSVQRRIAKAPFVVTTQALTPVSVAAGTTAEQTFTVPLLNASTSVLVSKPSYTPGLHVVGARVSAASTLAITYQNSGTTAVVPPAETYTIAAVPLQGPGSFGTAGATTNSIAVGFSGGDANALGVLKALQTLGVFNAS